MFNFINDFKLLSLLILFLSVFNTNAQLHNPLGSDNLMEIINRILSFIIFKLSPPLVSLFVLFGAYQIIFSMGNPEKFKKGKQTIFYTIIGYLIVLLSYGLVEIIKDIIK